MSSSAIPPDPHHDDNAYFIDAESATEMTRLMHQDRLFTQAMGGLFPEISTLPDFSQARRILDLACGPGGWALDVANAFPKQEVVGVDISHQMIEYAKVQAQVQGSNNARFHVMDITKPLAFADQSFDLVNARLIGFLPIETWPELMHECRRITHPGSWIRLTETELGISTSAALQHIQDLFTQSMKQAGQSFSPDGRHIGISTQLERFLREAGCSTIQKKAHVLTYSFGTDAHDSFCQDLMIFYKLIQPFFIGMKVATAEEVEQVYQQMLMEIQQEDFCAEHLLFTAWGKRR